MGSMKDKLNEIHKSLSLLRKGYPEETLGFTNFMEKVGKGGALDPKTKELIAVALSICCHCEWCIAFHVDAAIKAGATKDELIESGFEAVLMGGGPALMYMQPLVKAIEELSG
jgi:AhpD family alkylhydroperoxidase